MARKAKGKRVIKDNDDDNTNEGDEEKMSGKLNQKEVKEMHNFTPEHHVYQQSSTSTMDK